MTQTLYNLRTSDLSYRITKFTDGEVESSYLTSDQACDCPAGHRYTCRHRAMLPELFPIRDTQWFYNYDSGAIVDLMGTPKPACVLAEQDTERQTFTIPDGHMAERDADGRATGKVVPAGQHTTADTLHFNKDYTHSIGQSPAADALPEQTVRTSPAWRRL